MAKRFTDTDKWDRPWFRKLSNTHKLLWFFILDKCDIAGIWYVDIEMAAFQIGVKIDQKKAEEAFEKQVETKGNKWLIKDFIGFQYGNLEASNKVYRGVSQKLYSFKEGASIPLLSPIDGGKDKDKDKDMVKDVVVFKEGGVGETKSAHADFVKSFSETYASKTAEPYKAEKKDYILAANLIRSHGLDACVKKAMVLAALCQTRSAWFTKDGWASYTIGKLSGQWNSIIPEARQLSNEEEVKLEMKKQEELRERADRLVK